MGGQVRVVILLVNAKSWRFLQVVRELGSMGWKDYMEFYFCGSFYGFTSTYSNSVIYDHNSLIMARTPQLSHHTVTYYILFDKLHYIFMLFYYYLVRSQANFVCMTMLDSNNNFF